MRLKHIIRWLALPVGLVIFLLGAITFPLPLPTGLILMVFGLAIAAINPIILRWVKRTRKKYPQANQKIRKVTPHVPGFLGRMLKRTDNPERK